MSIQGFKRFIKGLVVEPATTDPTDNLEGSLYSNSTSNRMKTYIEGASREIVTTNQTQTLTNKSMDGGSNTFTNLPGSAIGSGINATAIADGSVDNTEFETLNGITSNIQTQLNTKVTPSSTDTLTNKTLVNPIINVEVLTEQGSTPSNPSAGSLKVYSKTDDQLYSLNSSGIEKLVGSSGGDPSYKLVGGGILSIGSSGGSNTPIATNLASGGGGLGIMSATNEFQAQTFQASSSGTLSQATFRMVKNIGGSLSGNMVVKVYTDNLGQPGTLLATSSGVNSSVLTTSAADINFAFSAGPTLATSTTYWAVMNVSAVTFGGGAEVITKQNSANSYAFGSNYLSTDGGATYILIGANYDLIFEIDIAVGGNPTLAFTSSLFLEKGGLTYSDNTITTSQSPIIFPSDLNVAYVTPNLTTGGPNLTVTVGTLSSVPNTAFIIARRFGTEILVDNRLFTQINLNGELINNVADPVSPQDVVTLNYFNTHSTGGSVSSVALALPVSVFSVSGSPVTSTGTLTGSLISQSANTFLAAPNGSSGTPTFRSIVSADIPTLNQNTTGTASNITGIAAVANGGTGLATLTANNVILGNGTSSPLFVAPGTIGNVLISNGTTWTSTSAGVIGAITATLALTSNFTSVANGVVKYDTVTTDTNSAYSVSTGLYTVPQTGNYLITHTNQLNSGISSFYVAVNGTNKAFLTTNDAINDVFSGSVILPLVAGNTVGIFTDTGSTTIAGNVPPTNTFTITLQGATIGATPVAASLDLTSNYSMTANNPIKYDTVTFDTNSAYSISTGLYTIPVGGKYRVSTVGYISNTSGTMYVTKNSTNVGYLVALTAVATTFSASRTITCSVGDTVGISSDTSAIYVGNSLSLNNFSIELIR